MNGTTKSGQERKRNGQYGADLAAGCKCGHALGQHTAERPYECLECETCECFTRAVLADSLRKCMGAVQVTVTDGETVTVSPAQRTEAGNNPRQSLTSA